MKQRFKVEDNRVIYTSWENDEDWTEIYLETKWKEMRDWVCKILAPEDNRGLPHRLVVAVQKKKVLLVN